MLRRVGLVVTILLIPGAFGAAGNIDATLNTDASNTRDPASLLAAFGTYQGVLAPDDVDWYRVDAPSSGPQCTEISFSGAPAKLMLEHEAFGTVRAVHTSTRDLSGKAAVASPAGGSAYFGVAHLSSTATATYTLSSSARGLPARSTGDAMSGGDAGATLPSSLLVSPGCIGGFLSPTDARDVYAFSIPAGSGLVYSLAASTSTPLRATILDASGALVGTLAAGGLGTFNPPTGGTFYIAVASESGQYVEDAYLLALTVGPPDPGSSCRPYC